MSWNFTFSMDGKAEGKAIFSFFGIKCILGIVRLKNEIIIVAKTNIDVWVYYTTGWFSSWIFPFMMNNWLPEIFINVFVNFFSQLTQSNVKEWFFASPKPSSRGCIKRKRMWCFWNILCTVQECEGSFLSWIFSA